MSEGKFDQHRRLCPDGGCIGVVGDDGRCKVCGRSAGGAPAPAGFVPSAAEETHEDQYEDQDGDDDADDAQLRAQAGEPGRAAAGGGFDPNRRLCPDGSCLGVLGADGVCNVCGQKAD